MAKTVEVEFDTPRNGCPWFLPLGMSIRGRFVLARVTEPTAGSHLDRLGPDIPGQRLSVNWDTGEGQVLEPLLEERHRDVRTRLEQRLRVTIAHPGRPVKIHPATWAFWLRRMVEDGVAKVVSGAIPTDIKGTPTLSVLTRKESPAHGEELATLRASNEALAAQLAQVLGRLDAVEKRKTG